MHKAPNPQVAKLIKELVPEIGDSLIVNSILSVNLDSVKTEGAISKL